MFKPKSRLKIKQYLRPGKKLPITLEREMKMKMADSELNSNPQLLHNNNFKAAINSLVTVTWS